MVYQHVNKRTAMLSLATSHTAHQCTQLNHVALPFLCHVLIALFFIKIAPKLSLFCKKMQTFRALGALPPYPRASGGWGRRPQAPSLRQLGASSPDPRWPPAAGGSAPRPPRQPPHCEFLATRLGVHLSAGLH